MTGRTMKSGWMNNAAVWRITAWSGAALLLLAPLAAMQVTREVQWTASDFAVFGIMLAVPLAVLEVALRASGDFAFRIAVVIALGAAFLMTWANLAVGIIGNENDPLNDLFFGVLLVGVVGAFVARFRPEGLARTMAAMAAAQALIAVIALVQGHFVVVLTGVFVTAWLMSAWLFRKAAREALPAA